MLRSDWLHELARWVHHACLGFSALLLQGKVLFRPVKKSVNNQACSVKMAAYWSRSFFCVLIDQFY